jgi:hypothetical protein
MEIKKRSEAFQANTFIFEGRNSNFKAHNLARFSTSLDISRDLWLGNPYSQEIPIIIMLNQ